LLCLQAYPSHGKCLNKPCSPILHTLTDNIKHGNNYPKLGNVKVYRLRAHFQFPCATSRPTCLVNYKPILVCSFTLALFQRKMCHQPYHWHVLDWPACSAGTCHSNANTWQPQASWASPQNTHFYEHCTLIQTQAFQCHAPHATHWDTSANSAEEKKRKIAYLQKQLVKQGN